MVTANRPRESRQRNFLKVEEGKEEGMSASNVLALVNKFRPDHEGGNKVAKADNHGRAKTFEEEVKLTFSNCIHCGGAVTRGYIGRWGDGGTCSMACESAQEAKPRDWGEPSKKKGK